MRFIRCTRTALAGALFFVCNSSSFPYQFSVLNPDVTQDSIQRTICIPGYTKEVRPAAGFTNGVKDLMLERDGLDPSRASEYELDHIIPLALGGHPRNIDNLQLQPLEEAKRKDRIEVKLQCLVCSGQLPLERAQSEILEDWQAAYHRYAKVKCHRHN